jgi:PKD repeat protein
MANDGYLIWRSDFDSMYYFDGSHPPVKFLDTIQVENPYVAGGSIGFFGLKLSEKNSPKYAWLYEINTGRLTQLTTDSSNSWNVLCDGRTACWLNLETERLMFYDGTNTVPLSDSAAGSDYSYRSGGIVWTERRSGVWQVMMYDVATRTITQLTHGATSTAYPLTDGAHVIWYENPDYPLASASTVMWYYDITAAKATKVAHAQYPTLYWNWMTNGKVAWAANGNVLVFDGAVISQLTNDDFSVNSGVYLDRGMLVWRRTPPPPAKDNGQVFTGKLRPHAAFDALNISGTVPLTVSFHNRAWEGDLAYTWDFGDGETSSDANPMHTYTRPGKWTVGLTVHGPGGSTTERKMNLVRAVSSTSTSAGDASIPQSLELFQNYPNPFNPTTKIQFSIVNSQFTILKVFDILGREIVTLVNELKSPGKYSVLWDASDCSSGVYCVRLQAGSITETRKALLLH